MKTKFVFPLAVFVVVMLLPVCPSAQAGFLDDIMGNSSGYSQTYTYSATHSGRPQDSGAMQYISPGAYAATPVAPRQPSPPQAASPRVAYQQPILQAQEIPQQRVSSKAAVKKKGNGAPSVKAQPANRRQAAPVARTYQPNYGRAQQTGYYTNPYQAQYTASPNYYKGYYNNWGSSSLSCPPGRA